MRIAIIGPGRIGGNVARQAVRGGHEVRIAFSRDPGKLEALAAELGDEAAAAEPADAVAWAEVVVLSVGWDLIGDALGAMGSLDGKIVIDTTNQYGSVDLPPAGRTAAAHNAARMPGARYTKSFNTLTSAFQTETAGRTGDDRVVQWVCGDDEDAKRVVSGILEDMGYAPVDLGGVDDCAVMEAPRRPGAVYGEEWHPPEAAAVAEAVKAGEPIPPTPAY
jgi:predicted dinucleotide-binding enzyme